MVTFSSASSPSAADSARKPQFLTSCSSPTRAAPSSSTMSTRSGADWTPAWVAAWQVFRDQAQRVHVLSVPTMSFLHSDGPDGVVQAHLIQYFPCCRPRSRACRVRLPRRPTGSPPCSKCSCAPGSRRRPWSSGCWPRPGHRPTRPGLTLSYVVALSLSTRWSWWRSSSSSSASAESGCRTSFSGIARRSGGSGGWSAAHLRRAGDRHRRADAAAAAGAGPARRRAEPPAGARSRTPRDAAIFALVVVIAGGIREELQRAFHPAPLRTSAGRAGASGSSSPVRRSARGTGCRAPMPPSRRRCSARSGR